MYIGHRKSDIGNRHQTSNIKKQIADIGHQSSDIGHQTSENRHRTRDIRHLTSDINKGHRTSDIGHRGLNFGPGILGGFVCSPRGFHICPHSIIPSTPFTPPPSGYGTPLRIIFETSLVSLNDFKRERRPLHFN